MVSAASPQPRQATEWLAKKILTLQTTRRADRADDEGETWKRNLPGVAVVGVSVNLEVICICLSFSLSPMRLPGRMPMFRSSSSTASFLLEISATKGNTGRTSKKDLFAPWMCTPSHALVFGRGANTGAIQSGPGPRVAHSKQRQVSQPRRRI